MSLLSIIEPITQVVTQTVTLPTTTSIPGVVPPLDRPEWEGIGAIAGIILGLIAIAVSVIAIAIARRHKALEYEVLSITPLLSLKEGTSIRSKLDVKFKNTSVPEPYLLQIKFINAGNEAIRPADYDGSLTLGLGKTSVVHDVEIVSSQPKSLRPKITPNGASAIIPATLMNRRSWYIVQLLVNQFDGPVSLDGQIADVTIRQRREFQPLYLPIESSIANLLLNAARYVVWRLQN
ncbi:MAG: hypothetical protein M3441_06660 [Chloroflexota bacterium]|nr:hypothetical protein [Chloroflexota bacterium]